MFDPKIGALKFSVEAIVKEHDSELNLAKSDIFLWAGGTNASLAGRNCDTRYWWSQLACAAILLQQVKIRGTV